MKRRRLWSGRDGCNKKGLPAGTMIALSDAKKIPRSNRFSREATRVDSQLNLEGRSWDTAPPRRSEAHSCSSQISTFERCKEYRK